MIPKQFDSLRLPPSLKQVRMNGFCREDNHFDFVILLLTNEDLELEKIIVEVNENLEFDAALLLKLRPPRSACTLDIRRQQLKTSLSASDEFNFMQIDYLYKNTFAHRRIVISLEINQP